MKQIELNSGSYLLVEVDEKAKNFQLRNGTGYLIGFLTVKKLPPGQWSIIGKADELDIGTWENEDIVKNIPVSEQRTTLILKLN